MALNLVIQLPLTRLQNGYLRVRCYQGKGYLLRQNRENLFKRELNKESEVYITLKEDSNKESIKVQSVPREVASVMCWKGININPILTRFLTFYIPMTHFLRVEETGRVDSSLLYFKASIVTSFSNYYRLQINWNNCLMFNKTAG